MEEEITPARRYFKIPSPLSILLFCAEILSVRSQRKESSVWQIKTQDATWGHWYGREAATLGSVRNVRWTARKKGSGVWSAGRIWSPPHPLLRPPPRTPRHSLPLTRTPPQRLLLPPELRLQRRPPSPLRRSMSSLPLQGHRSVSRSRSG